MSHMARKATRRPRREFTDEYKASVVELVLDQGKTVAAVSRELDLTETAVRKWVERARADRGDGKAALTRTEREELTRLRRQVRVLEEEREILKKATAFFAKHHR